MHLHSVVHVHHVAMPYTKCFQILWTSIDKTQMPPSCLDYWVISATEKKTWNVQRPCYLQYT